jgi:Asp-tRNA(Asn)/Glu-tRNA(Gln) amidotransferase A subunit family amidase
MSDSLAQLAASARAAGDRLLHARPMAARQVVLAQLAALVTAAPLDTAGADGPLFGVPVTVKGQFCDRGPAQHRQSPRRCRIMCPTAMPHWSRNCAGRGR